MAAKQEDSDRLPFEIDERIDPSLVTAHAGVPLLIELFRKVGAAAVVDEQVILKQRRRGLTSSQMVESAVALWASGGERVSDLGLLREDAALAALVGFRLPAANTMRDFLEAFREEDLPLWQAGEHAAVPLESAALQGLQSASERIIVAVAQKATEKCATLDIDATILESEKRAAQLTYKGSKGFQPVIALWAEQDLILHDEFRDGNVPAGCSNQRIVEKAVAALPAAVEQILLRGDSALYESALLSWCEGCGIGYAISADMTPQLREQILRLPEAAWQEEAEQAEATREWAEVTYVPEDRDHRKDRPCVRWYLAIRIRARQGQLFADGSTVKHFAIVTNREGDGVDLIRWHRGKAGSVEHAHHVLKNELAAEALPSGRFAANAAWFQMNVLTYNLLSALKRVALPGEFLNARPKRLRFNTVGKVIHHARRTLLRLACLSHQSILQLARAQITSFAQA
jgi:hypothetical protein